MTAGQPISFNRLANTIKSTGTRISTDTVIKYIEYACEAFLIFSLSNYAATIAEKESNRKYYFVDNGIMSLLGINMNLSLFENIVAMTLIRHYGTKDRFFY